jgi:ribulose-phosphate 3-epimerase
LLVVVKGRTRVSCRNGFALIDFSPPHGTVSFLALKNKTAGKRARKNNNNLTGKVKMKKLISPSILSADFSKIGQEVKALENAGADYIHIDVMDGHFVPNITIGPLVVDAVKRITDIPLDVHLMIENPDFYIDAFAKAGSDILTVHAEAGYHLHRTLQAVKDKGIKAAVSLNPATSLNVLDHILEDVDTILIMTVNPGFGGQKFIRPMLQKTKDLKSKIEKAGLDIAIEVDGGIVLENIKEASDAGADIFVSGSGILNTPDYGKTISAMKKIIG